MTNLKKIGLLFSLVLIVGTTLGNDKFKSTNSFNSFNLYKLKNQWISTGNAAGIVFNPAENIGDVYGGLQFSDGDFYRTREAKENRELFLQSESYQKIKNLNFYGSFSYHNANEKGGLWNGVYSPYRGNPYIVGDSIPGANYHKESYKLSGGIAGKINDHIALGCRVDYFVGVGAKQKDPRPENVVMQFVLNPGIIINTTNSKIGFDIGYRNRKEEIDNIQVASNQADPIFFTFKSFGFYTYTVNSGYDRFQLEKDFFGGLQYETSLLGFESLSEIRGNYSIEKIDDGTSVIKQENAGDWKTINIKFNQQLIAKTNNAFHKINLVGSFLTGDGIEYTQEPVFDDDYHTEYITLSKNLKFTRQTISGKLEYNYLALKTDEKINWDIKAHTGYILNNEKYHYIPEVFTANYSNIDAGIDIVKNIYRNNIHLAPGLLTSYRYNLSNELNLSNDPSIIKKQNTEIFTNDFNFYKENILKLTGKLNIGIDTNSFKNIDQIYIKLYYNYLHTFDLAQHQGNFVGKIGFVF
jgi:hypothetical protein